MGKENEHSFIQEQGEKGLINYKSADYLRAELLVGLEEYKIAQSFLEIAKPLKNIKSVVEALHKQKIECLQDFCRHNSIKPHECISVGDGSTDTPIFEYLASFFNCVSMVKYYKG